LFLTALVHNVNGTPGFESWRLDYTEESIQTLSQWMWETFRPDTITVTAKNVPELTYPIGVYLGEAIIANYKDMLWEPYPLTKDGEKVYDFGHP
jgi:hypothetical protein